MKNVARLGKWLQDKRNFLKYSLFACGIPATAFSIYVAGREEGLLYWAFLSVLSFGAAYLWGLIMWHIFVRNIAARRREGPDDST
jgi:predicted permease